MKVLCNLKLQYGSSMEFWCVDEVEAATKIKELKDKGVVIEDVSITTPKPVDTSNLH